jgi:hypothetical protein
LDRLNVEVGNTASVSYAPHVHYGTGIYGKYKKPIVLKEKKALKTPYGVFKSVKGQKPNPYLDKALQDYRNSGKLDETLREAGQEITKAIADNIKIAFKRFK